MCPFSKKPKTDIREDRIEKLRSFRDIGETFNYLGRTCIVTGHWELWPYVGRVPKLRFDYCDDLGVLHSMSAWPEELPGLIAQNTET